MTSSEHEPSLGSPAKVGGGMKKVLYTLRTVGHIGPARATKALTSKNACKACGLGMGGQRGGMTNELGEFPSVCNKSVQAQSTDIQPAIPHEVFDHPLAELRELNGYELEHLGRLGVPIHKAPGDDRYRPVAWDWAIERAAEQFAATTPDRTFFYSSGRSSNEAGFLLQLLARAYGTNNINNCSFYCHQATSVGLKSTIGTGTATIEIADLAGCDLIFVIGANPSSNHPRFIHKLKECRDRGGDVVIINPAKEPGLVRFALPKSPKSLLTGGDEIASDYLQPRIGTDIALLSGVAKAVLENGREDQAFLDAHSAGAGYFKDSIARMDWDSIVDICGVPRADIERVAELYGKAERVVFAWGMGVTHHLHGVENVEAIANLALLRGMVGRRYAGLLPLRGHSNVQGIGTIGVKPVLKDEVLARMEETLGLTPPKDPGFDTMAAMRAAFDGNVDAALVMGGNLYGASPDQAWAAQALDRVDFKLFLTTTLNRGHVCGVDSGESLVLPVTARDEEWQPTTQESMFNYVRLSDGGITRLDTVRPEVAILCDLAERLLPDSPVDFSAFREHARIRDAIAATVPGLEKLASIDVAKREFHVSGRLLHDPEFKTQDGLAHFRVLPLRSEKASADEAAPFTLTTVRSEGQFNTIIYEQKDSYRGTTDRWSVLMNAHDIASLEAVAGDFVEIRSAHGRMDRVRVYPYDLPPGNVMVYFPEANVLTGTAVDPRSKTPSFKAVPVWIDRVVEG
ncbi:MAG: FdhF/YdeP family oxidoreductase [Alphaproteobacteria bacterium]